MPLRAQLTPQQSALRTRQLSSGPRFTAERTTTLRNDRDRFWRARLLNTLGWVYQDLLSLDLALQYSQASLNLARTGAPRLTEAEGYALVNLAMTQLLLGRSDQARGVGGRTGVDGERDIYALALLHPLALYRDSWP